MPTAQEESLDLAKSLLLQLANPNLPLPERLVLKKLFDAVKDSAFQQALGNFRSATSRFLELSSDLEEAIRSLGGSASPALAESRDRLGEMHRLVHDDEGMRTTWQTSEEFEEQFDDENDLPPTPEVTALPARPTTTPPLVAPKPINSKSYADLSDEYVRFFHNADFSNNAAGKQAERFAETAIRNRGRYEAVGDPLQIPWWFIAAVHLLESSFNFTTHLHNGDSLRARTHRVPQGRPRSGRPPFTWEESARDALQHEKLANLRDWSLARTLFRWEAYNGFGYRPRGVASPYLWSFTTIYARGKFVGDGVFDRNAVSKQCGAAAFLKALAAAGVADLRIEGFAEANGPENAESDAVDADAASTKPNVDGSPSTNVDFQDFFTKNLPDVTDFAWHEFMVKGSSHQASGKNTDPPRELWPNIQPVARVLQRLRSELGQKVVLTSVYRSPAYNASIGGARKSQHMQFCAADFKVSGGSRPADWAAILKRYRSEGMFDGGVGLYNSFVHVDSRGYSANW